jgi:hypothetical protein
MQPPKAAADLTLSAPAVAATAEVVEDQQQAEPQEADQDQLR